ncbi:MAG: hypothetical protein KJ645_13865 [Planctomycetes bacterium]|nr:hypothetical protein [Planctomycetota bacterium]
MNKRDGIIALAVMLTGAVFHAFYFNHGIHNLMDLGVQAVDSARILDGQIYGLDFQAPYGPARYYLIAGTFLLFGKSLFVINGLFVGIMMLNNLLIYLNARFLMTRPYALFASFLGIIAHGSIHKSFFMLSGLLVLFFLFRFLTLCNGKSAFCLGLALGGVMLFRWDVGVVGICAVIVISAVKVLLKIGPLPLPTRHVFFSITAGCSVVLVPVILLLFLFSDPLRIAHHVMARVSGVGHVSTDFESWPDLFASPEPRARLFTLIAGFLIVSMLTCLVLVVFRLLKNRRPHTLHLAALTLVGLPMLNQVHIQIRFNRLLHAAPLLFISLSYVLSEINRCVAVIKGRRLKNNIRSASFVLGAVFLACLSTYLYQYSGLASQDSVASLRYEERYVSHPRAQCFMRKGLAKDLEEVLSILEQRIEPEDTIFADPSCALFYFLLDRPNPTPYTDWLFYYFNPEAEKRMIADLERSKVKICVFWPDRPVAKEPFETACPELKRYLDECFDPFWKGRRFVLLERKRRR